MSRKNKTADSLVKTNEEYSKLKGDRPERGTPRELPGRQAPGEKGHAKPEYSRWTVNELRDLAAKLGVDDVENRSHAELVEILDEQDAADARRHSPP